MTASAESVPDGRELYELASDLFPINRSLTGEGVRKTLTRIAQEIPLSIHEVPTGTSVLDWDVPREWNVRSARIEDLKGRILVDFSACNLHLVSYSGPVDRIVSRDELTDHIHTLPEQPDLIPYRTGYYADSWGFCLAHAQWQSMQDPAYRVVIESTLEAGSLTYGELHIPGEIDDEVLISAHCCHPSLANDNLSGIVVAAALAKHVCSRSRHLSYRFVFAPATIGAITWLAMHEERVNFIKHGLILTCVGDSGAFNYKQSRRAGAPIDRAVNHILERSGKPFNILPFSPTGYDERQYCSPGYNLPVGCFMRSPNGTFPEYHTSADNLFLIKPEALEDSCGMLRAIVDLLDGNRVYLRRDGRGEPQLGRRGLYRAISGQKDVPQVALLWVLNLADGEHSLLEIAERSRLPFAQIRAAADLALSADLITEAIADASRFED
jgi:aminopeptidase-like protein